MLYLGFWLSYVANVVLVPSRLCRSSLCSLHLMRLGLSVREAMLLELAGWLLWLSGAGLYYPWWKGDSASLDRNINSFCDEVMACKQYVARPI